MATTRVFVDDAVTGHLPAICVKEGTPTHGGMVTLTQEVGRRGLGALWLLVLFGPIGWLAIAVAATLTRGERLQVALPMGTAARDRYRAARRDRNTVLGLGLGLGLLLVLLAAAGFRWPLPAVAVVGLVAGVVAWCVAEYRIGRTLVDVRLDASRRWVTLKGVHPAFARAADEQARRRVEAESPVSPG